MEKKMNQLLTHKMDESEKCDEGKKPHTRLYAKRPHLYEVLEWTMVYNDGKERSGSEGKDC